MISINPSDDSVRLILTLTDKTTIEDPAYKLVLNSPYTNKTYRVDLGENASTYRFRYDEFILDSEIFKNMEVGIYFYSIYQTEEESNPIEVGLFKIIGEVETGYLTLPQDETDDDYLVYSPQ